MGGGVGGYWTKRSRDAPAEEARKPVRKPKLEDFNSGAVTKAVLKETLEHPATIYPVVVGTGAGLAMCAILGVSTLGLGLIFGGLAIGGTAWIVNFVARGEKRAERHVARLREQLREAEQHEVIELSQECEELGFEDGAKRARKLTTAYQNLRTYMREYTERHGGQTLETFRILADGTHKEGAALLRQAVDKFKALEKLDLEALELEIKESQRARKKLGDGSDEAQRLDQEIETNTRRLERFRKSEAQLSKLLAQVKNVESALQSTYLELVDLGSSDPITVLAAGGGATKRLETAVEAARRVAQRLNGEEDPEDKARSDEYLRAAENERLESETAVDAARRVERKLSDDTRAADSEQPDQPN